MLPIKAINMEWQKLGLIYCPSGEHGWDKHSALVPTPILMDENTIRVYAGFRDNRGISRIGYVDVDSRNPRQIIEISDDPVLDIGMPATFDDHGVIPGAVMRHPDELLMYYVGYQIPQDAKFLAFTGLAISKDGGKTFRRHSQAPILDRSNESPTIRTINSVIIENIDCGVYVFRTWCTIGDGWEIIKGAAYPRYHIGYIESEDGTHFAEETISCLMPNKGDGEYRIGAPHVYQHGSGYIMFYTYGTIQGSYLAGYAESPDGIHWTRQDKKIGIEPSKEGWDDRHLSYPSIITCHNKTYMFYNGNDMGKTGFGAALLLGENRQPMVGWAFGNTKKEVKHEKV